MLEGLIKDINFVKGSKFEKKGKNLLVRNSDRTTLQENLEKYFKSKNDVMYVYTGGSSYQQLSPLGVPNKVYEIGTTNTEVESAFTQNVSAVKTENVPADSYVSMAPEVNKTDQEDPIKICK